jgi:hypothetical protein
MTFSVHTGGGHAPFFMGNAGAEEEARRRARANLKRALDEAVEPVHCPGCGIYQPAMVQVLREQHGKRCEPNKYASERIAVPVAHAWRAACAANTLGSYTKFMSVWPTYSWHARKQIRELKYPPHLRKLAASFLWALWGVLFAFIVGISFGRM